MPSPLTGFSLQQVLRWQQGQSSTGIADKARSLSGARYAKFLVTVSA